MKKTISLLLVWTLLLQILYVPSELWAQDAGAQPNPARDITELLKPHVEKSYISDGKTITETSQIDISKRFSINLKISVPVIGDSNDATVHQDSYVRKGDFALIELSENLIIPQNYRAEMTGSMVELNSGASQLVVGHIELLHQNGKDYAKLTFDGDDNIFSGMMHSVTLQHEIELQVDRSKVIEDNNERYITLFGKKIILEKTENLTVTKSGQLDATNKQIVWTIRVSRTDGAGLPMDLSGYILEEDFIKMPQDQYDHGKLQQLSYDGAGQEQLRELAWDGDQPYLADHRLRYTLPQGSQGQLEFRLVTALRDRQFYLSAVKGEYNYIRLYNPAGEELKKADASVTLPKHDWIEKGTHQKFESNGEYYATWEITINRDEQDLKNVVIEDILPPDMTFVRAQWRKGISQKVGSEVRWSYEAVGGEINLEPAGGVYRIGDIKERYQLLLTTRFDLQEQVTKIFTNTATVKWGDGVAFQQSHSMVIGNEDVFRKYASGDVTAQANLVWKFETKASFLQTLNEPKIYDLMVYRSDITKAHLLDKDKVSGLPQGIMMRDVIPSDLSYLKYQRTEQDGSLDVRVYPITYNGEAVADLVEIGSTDKSKNWNFTIHTLPMLKWHIASRGDKKYMNTAMLFDNNRPLISSTALTRYEAHVMKKHLLEKAVVPLMAKNPSAELANRILPNKLNEGYHAKERKALFRIDINLSRHTALADALGNMTLVDYLPKQLEFTSVNENHPYLVFRSTPKFTESVNDTNTWREIHLTSTQVTGEPLTAEEINNLGMEIEIKEQYGRRHQMDVRFAGEIEGTYSILVAAKVYEPKLKEMFLEDGEKKLQTSNMIQMHYAGTKAINGVTPSTIYALEEYRTLDIDVTPLEKRALIPTKDEERNGTINWEVFVNTYHVVTDHPQIKMQDKLGAGLELKADTVADTKRPVFITLKEYDNETDTTPTEIVLEFGKNIEYNVVAGIMTVTLPSKDKRYQLNYTTEIKRDNTVLAGTDLANQVALVVENHEVSKVTAKYQVMRYDVNVEYFKNGVLEILKVDDSPERLPLAGAEFTLVNVADGKKTVYQTNDKGYIRLIHLKQGEYILKETKAPDGFVLPDTEYRVTVRNKTGIVGVEVLVDNKEVKSIMNIINHKKVVPPPIPATPVVVNDPPVQPYLPPYVPKEEPGDTPKDAPKDAPKDTPKDTPKEEPKKPEPPKVEIPMTPLVPATPIVKEEPKKPVQPVNPNVPRRPRRRIPGVPYDELEDGVTPFGNPNSPLYPWDEEPRDPDAPIEDSTSPFGRGELPKTDGIPLENMIYLGLFFFGTGTLLKKKR